MTLVKLKMRFIYKIILFMIALVLALAVVLGSLYYKFKDSVFGDSAIDADGYLSINYLDGKRFNLNSNRALKISITNSDNSVKYYRFLFSKVRGKGSYKLLYNNTVVTEGDLKPADEILTDYLSIDASESKTYSLEVYTDSNIKGTLGIRNTEEKLNTFADTILQNNKVKSAPTTKVGIDLAFEDEGLIKDVDDVGPSYYFRGKVENNYVSFGDMLWRIVRINGDGSVRLILDGETSSIASYWTDENKNMDYKSSNIHSFLLSWLNDNLGDLTDYIASAKFCNDIGHDEDWTFHANTRILVNNIPALSCAGTQVRSASGLLSIDEVILAGANTKNSNKAFYLYNSDLANPWVTMTAHSGSEGSLTLFMVNTDGSLETHIVGNLNRGVRPVINLKKNIEMTGDGTINNPWTIVE